MPKLLMVIFTENSSLGASMLCNLAQEYGWIVDIYFVPPKEGSTQLELYIGQYKPDLIAFSFKSFERKQAFSVAGKIRKVVDIKMIAGGIHPTLMPDEVVQTGFFDAVTVGDGMGIFEDILDNYQNFNDDILWGKPNSNKKLYSKYFYSKTQIKRMKSTETCSILSAIGCPFQCRFCHSGSDKFQVLPIEDVALQVLELYNKYGVRCYHFVDDLFACNMKRLQKFRHIIEQSCPDFSISSQVSGKPSTFTKAIAEELVKLGVETMNFGVETASPRLLKFLNKDQTVEDCYRAVQICHEFGLNCVINLMFGIPTQDENDYKETLEFVKISQPDSVTCFFYSPYPGTELYDYCFDNYYLPDTFDRNRFDWFNPAIDGISDIQLRLNNVDYDLAMKYLEKTKQVTNRDTVLFERMNLVDTHPWVLVGTTRHYYFKTILKHLSAMNWKNCLGYINTDAETGFQLEEDGIELLPIYNDKIVPFWCVTHSFLGADFAIIEKYAKKRFHEEMPLISISSFKRSHSVEDIKKYQL